MPAETQKKAVPPPRPYPVSLLAPTAAQEQEFRDGVRNSAIAHGVGLLVALIATFVTPHAPVKFMQTMRVDIVGLPDLKKADLAKLPADDVDSLSKKLKETAKKTEKLVEQAKKDKVETPPAPDEMALKKEKPKPQSKKELLSAIERIKALAAVDEPDTNKKPSKQPPKVQAKGNQLSQGDSNGGGIGIDTNAFISAMRSKLQENWNLPVWLSKQNLSAKVVIFLDRKGFVSNTVMAKSSGNPQFDEFCLKTIRMSQPFGPPPGDLAQTGLTLGFPL